MTYFNLQYFQTLRTYVQNVYTYHRQYIYDVLAHQYGEWDRPTDATALRDCAMELLGDGQYVAPVIELAQLHARLGATTYLYAFNYVARTGKVGAWVNIVVQFRYEWTTFIVQFE